MSTPTRLLLLHEKKDNTVAERLLQFLQPLEVQGKLAVWHWEKTLHSEDMQAAFEKAWGEAQIYVLLVTVDLLSGTRYPRERVEALMQDTNRRVLPVIVRHCPWEQEPFAKLSVLPKVKGEVKVMKEMDSLDEGLQLVFNAIQATATELIPPKNVSGLTFSIRPGSLLDLNADVIALKYAQNFYGVARAASNRFLQAGVDIEVLKMPVGQHILTPVQGAFAARYALFTGVDTLHGFHYPQIHAYSRSIIVALPDNDPSIKHLATTNHGVGYGLDERESLLKVVSGMLAAVIAGEAPESLQQLSIVELDPERCKRLTQYLAEEASNLGLAPLSPNTYVLDPKAAKAIAALTASLPTIAPSIASDKPYIYVDLPPDKEYEDLYFFGIQAAAHPLGFDCMKIDHENFNVSVIEEINDRISYAKLFITDLSKGGEDAYLQIGLALGKGVPTVVLLRDTAKPSKLLTDVKILNYANLMGLNALITQEIKAIAAKP